MNSIVIKGERGDVGYMGPQGIRGAPGQDGYNGIKGRDGRPGLMGVKGRCFIFFFSLKIDENMFK